MEWNLGLRGEMREIEGEVMEEDGRKRLCERWKERTVGGR
jgi:hypothetical protein